MGRKRNRKDLAEAWATDRPVVVRRNLWKADHLEGYVVDLADRWVLLHLVREVDLNGWAAVRLDTVREVTLQGRDAFIARALHLAGEDPEPVDLDLDGAGPLIATACRQFPIVTLYTEEADPGLCAIGRPRRLTATRAHFLDISSEGEWADATRKIRLDEVTRVDVGGSYEAVLHHLGGYPPIPG
jgi:hypothetical protein